MSDRIEDLVSRASSAQLCRMLRLVEDTQGTDEEAIEAFADKTELAAVLDEIGYEKVDGAALVEEVLAEEVTLPQLEAVHRLSRGLRKCATTPVQKVAADMLYQASIAAAYQHLGVNLGSRPIAARRALFLELAEKLGPSDLGRLFARAAE